MGEPVFRNAITEKTPADRRAMMARAWHEFGLIVIDPDFVTNWTDRQHVVNLANKLYGQRDD